jgi:hypothetical protein
MEEKTLSALKFIAGILGDNNIPYAIGGGMATYLYGSGRQVNDIDISISGKYFSVLVPLVTEYIVEGPKHYVGEIGDKWDCTTLSLSYNGQDIDLTDADTLLMSKKDGTGWIRNIEIYKKYPTVMKEVGGIKVSLMDPRVLFEYKQELDGEHQEHDLKFSIIIPSCKITNRKVCPNFLTSERRLMPWWRSTRVCAKVKSIKRDRLMTLSIEKIQSA